jgi:hypothetical protein
MPYTAFAMWDVDPLVHLMSFVKNKPIQGRALLMYGRKETCFN